MVLKTWVFSFNKFYKKLFKTKLLNIYYSESYIKYYNFYQEYKDYFALAKAKNFNHLFVTLFLRNYINFNQK